MSSTLCVLHILITYILNARNNTNDLVTVKDMVLMVAAIEGKEVDTTSWLIRKLSDIKDAFIDI